MDKRDVIAELQSLAPEHLALDWDNGGLQIGSMAGQLKGVTLALTANTSTIQQAIALGSNLLITHHPPIFKAMKRIDVSTPQGRKVQLALQNDLSIYSAHTNLDVVTPGVGSELASRLGLENIEVLEVTADSPSLKLVTFVPATHWQAVLEAVCEAGAGKIGEYELCSFRTQGTGTFRPTELSNPYTGSPLQFNQESEERLEILLPKERQAVVIQALKSSHPYEEVAYDLLVLANQGQAKGLGRMGRWAEAKSLGEAIEHIKEALNIRQVRAVGDLTKPIQTVAVCGGSGGDLLGIAHRRGCDLLVTGDIRFHTADEAKELGVSIIDAGHEQTEIPALELLAEKVRAVVRDRVPIDVIYPEDPFWHC